MANFNTNSIKTLEKRYLLKNDKGEIIETPDQMLERVANTVCKDNTELKTKILEMMHDLRFLPNTPTLMNAGTTNMLSACFVVDIEDTLESIVHNAGWQQAYIHKMGGGVGMNFSKIRPKGDLIKGTGGVTTGVLGFLPIFNELSEGIRQGGKRDGANMGLLHISHPEIESWITAKVDNNRFRNFNLSVLITDAFMEAVYGNKDWNLVFKDKVYKTVKAQYLFDLICESAYKCGCPGVIFEDEINRNNPLKDSMWISCTNPCVTGDTLVMTSNGYRQVDWIKVEDIKVGDLIRTHNDELYPVKKIEINGDMEVYRIEFDNNLPIKVTKSHQFIVVKPYCTYANGEPIPIGLLPLEYIKVGDKIKKFDKTYTTVTSIEKLKKHETVYDLYEPITDTWITNGLISRGCGEQPLFVGKYNNELVAESCNLGSLNLSKYCIRDQIDPNRNAPYIFSTDQYIKDIHNAVEFLDLVIDTNVYPFDFIEKGTKLTRKIGLGVTGLSECLIKLRMEYGSEKSLKFIEEIMKILQDQSHLKSIELGKLKGSYPLINLTSHTYRRNLFTTTIAPTGTIGRFMLGHPYSSGIEPPPAIYMSSNIIDSKVDDGIHPLLIEMLSEYFLQNNKVSYEVYENIIIEIKKDGKSIQHIKEIPEFIRKLFKVAEEISIEEHIIVQSTIQKYIDNAVSKTINMRNDATIKDISNAYIMAHKTKCKGVTIYRDNCKEHQVFETHKKEIINTPTLEDLNPRPEILGSLSFTRKTACNTLFINPTYLNDNSALESFIISNGGCAAMRAGLAITISVYQRILETLDKDIAKKGLDIVMSHLEKIQCQVCVKQIEMEKHKENVKHPVDSISCPAAVANVMKYMLSHKVETFIDGNLLNYISKNKQSNQLIPKKKCPQCGSELFKQEGCMNDTCVCGWGGCN